MECNQSVQMWLELCFMNINEVMFDDMNLISLILHINGIPICSICFNFFFVMNFFSVP